MRNAMMEKCDTASNRSEIRRISRKNGVKIIVTSALLLAAISAFAGIEFLPASGMYPAPELAPVNVQHLGNDIVRIHTTGLTGQLGIRGSDFPPEYEVPASATGKLPVVQELELVINLSLGVVEGRASGQILVNNENMFVIEGVPDGSKEIIRFHADVRGNAICVPLNGLDCGQLVVDLELRGALSDPNDPASVGQLRMQMLSSLVVDNSDFRIWEAMSANTTIGGNEALIHSLFGMMGDANLDGS